MIFDAEGWYNRVQGEIRAFETLEAVFDLQGGLDQGLNELVGQTGEVSRREMEGAGQAPGIELLRAMERQIALASLGEALATHRRQMVVLAVTYFEVVTQDFFLATFTANPEAMYEFVREGAEAKGQVDLKELIGAASKQALLDALALRCARRVAKGDVRSIIKNVKRIAGLSLSDSLVEQLHDLVSQRNILVHEGARQSIDRDYARSALAAMMDYSELLGYIAQAADVPVRALSEPPSDNDDEFQT